MEETNHAIARWLTEAGWSETYVNLAVKAVIILGILVVAYAAAVPCGTTTFSATR